MKTKDKILTTALFLYNTEGTAHVSSRHIAEQMGISDGNLRYHFPRQEDIVFALYEQITREIDKELERIDIGRTSLADIFDSQLKVMHIFSTYRFIFKDFSGLVRKSEMIRKHFLELMEGRKASLAMMLEILRQRGLLREELVPTDYLYFINNLGILNNFWLNDAEIFHEQITPEVIRQYAVQLFGTLTPYLTHKGLKEFREWEQKNGNIITE